MTELKRDSINHCNCYVMDAGAGTGEGEVESKLGDQVRDASSNHTGGNGGGEMEDSRAFPLPYPPLPTHAQVWAPASALSSPGSCPSSSSPPDCQVGLVPLKTIMKWADSAGLESCLSFFPQVGLRQVTGCP